MAKSKTIDANQLKNLDWLGGTASVSKQDFELASFSDIESILLDYAEKFKDELLINIKKYQLTSSGTLEDNIIINPPYEEGTSKVLTINLPYYAKFVDKGVKGVRSSSNAPDSPYQFKNYGMSEDGRKSLKNYILSGRKKVTASDVKKYKEVTTAGEKKAISKEDAQLNRLIYLIKAFGIKTTKFYSDAVDKSFKGLEKEIADSIGVNIAINITK